MRKELHEKDTQLRLLPDLKRQMEEKEKEAHIKAAALEKQIELLQADFEHQGRVVDELKAEKESHSKILEDFRTEQEHKSKAIADLEQENERLRAAAESLSGKKGWWNWFLGRS